jgi:hypothetical protein
MTLKEDKEWVACQEWAVCLGWEACLVLEAEEVSSKI